ncbi:MAG TPA: apolipoprotein N-acyltransferase [Candidatus Polarisedimenticolia bacterium]|nr:apolipoprotein N-acyltransferase [Candidatus Polarisedimenticolia bacterium]
MLTRSSAAVATAILLVLSFPLADQGWLAFIALVPLLLVLRGAGSREAARLGFLTGTVFFAGLLSWLIGVMVRYGGLPYVVGGAILLLLVAYLAIYVMLFAAIVAAGLARTGPLAYLAAPCVWVGLELLRGRLLTGFPWGVLGATQWRHPALLQAASLGGVALVSGMVVAVNAALALLLARGARRAERLAAVVPLALVGAAALWGRSAVARLPQGDGEAIRVAAIQANVPQDRKWRPEEEVAIVSRLLDLSGRAAGDGAQLLLWPESSSPLAYYRPAGEGALPMPLEPQRAEAERVAAFVRERGVTLVAGAVQYRHLGGRIRAFNSAFVSRPDGGPGDSYDKVHLVPFGEYVPLQRVLFFVNRMVQGAVAEFEAGRSLEPLHTPFGDAGTLICYEAIFAGQVRRVARAGFLVNLTNDAWFGRSAAPRQHLALAVVRAAENHRWMARAANTGISAIVDPAGRVVAATPLEEERVLQGTIHARSDATPYAARGDVFGWACAIFAGFAGFVWRAWSRRRGD